MCHACGGFLNAVLRRGSCRTAEDRSRYPPPMPASRDRDGSLPEKPLLLDRLRSAMLREGPPPEKAGEGMGPEELEAAVRSADDKERLVGLIGAPLGAAIALLVTTALVDHDPSALLKDGQVNKLHVAISLYQSLGAVMVGLSVVMLVMAMLRKRLYLGIAMALYGLGIFNLHYWGFGIPYIGAGAWLLVRAYRLHKSLDEQTATPAMRSGLSAAKASGRYTPPASSRR